MSINSIQGTLVAADEAELATRLSLLSLMQKVRLLTGADIWGSHPEPAIGLRRVVTSDGPAGVRGATWDERAPSANVPSPTALAATWDEQRVHRIGELLADQARIKGVDVLLAPTVNLHRTPFGGRHFENLSEDPLLTARIGTAYVRGVQAGGIAATAKHYVANDSETDRLSADVIVDERTLRELYLAPFESLVREGRAWAVMAAYNQVNGTTMTENALQRDVLKTEWGFDGVVISDWYAGRSLAAAGEGLLDLVMPGPVGPWGDALVAAVRAGEVPESAVDDKVLRLLRLAARVGALDGIQPAVPPPVAWTETEIAAELRTASAAGMVLTRNAGDLLPLDSGALSRVAILGPNAASARNMGGGSATVMPPYTVSPLDGLRVALGNKVEVTYGAGVRPSDRLPAAIPQHFQRPDGRGPGLDVRFLGADGTVLDTEARHATSFLWWGAVTPTVDVGDVTELRISALLRVPEAGTYAVGVSGLGTFTLTLDGQERLQTTIALPADSDIVEGLMRPPQGSVDVDLTPEREVSFELRYRPVAPKLPGGDDVDMLSLQLNLLRRVDEDDELDHAVTLAAEADVAIVVVGTTEEVESEGFDRTTLALPGRQDELIRRVAAANPRTVVVINSGAPVLLPWADDVAAVLLSWFPGQEFGNALADILLGMTEPGGRLPTSWPVADDGHPAVTPVDGRLKYGEGLFVGYRAYDRDGRAPRYPFGHGLGYTRWSYDDVRGPASPQRGEDVAVTVRITNAGSRSGREVVQVYASRPHSALSRPVRWLAGFAGIELDAGESGEVEITVPARVFEHWDTGTSAWATETGPFQLEIGTSVADLPLRTEVTIFGPKV